MSFNNSTFPLLMQKAPVTFGIVDYVVFGGFLAISGGVGIFFSCRSQKTTNEYFFGNRHMKPIPVGISAGVSFLSAAGFIGLPAETYLNGYNYMIGTFFGSIAFCIGNMLIACVIHPLKMTNLNQYFAKRFKSKTILLMSHIMVLACIIHYMGLCMISSVIAFNGITGGQVSIVVALLIGFFVGIFYTSLGGMKAVIWTDVIQFGIMFIGVTIVLVKTIFDTPGGTAAIIAKNVEYSRIHAPNWSTDPTIRHTMWGMIIGAFFNWLIWSSQPASVQRLCSTRSQKDGYIVAITAGLVFIFFSFLPSWVGLMMFGYYASQGCDVHAAGWVKGNQIILYYVRDRLSFPGFQGLYVAAAYASSLSSLSSGLNAAAAIIWKDITQPILKVEVSERAATIISKVIVILFGLVSIIWCYTLSTFGALILQVGASIDSSIYGSYFGLFLLALFFRYVNSRGAIVGILASFSITVWLGLSSLLHGKHISSNLPSIVDSCTSYNDTTPLNITVSEVPRDEPFSIYNISYIWLSPISLSCLVMVSLMVSACTRPGNQKPVNPKYLFPLVRPGFFKKKFKCCQPSCEKDEEDDKLNENMNLSSSNV